MTGVLRTWPTGELERRIVPAPGMRSTPPLPRADPQDPFALPGRTTAATPAPRFAPAALLDRLKAFSRRAQPDGAATD